MSIYEIKRNDLFFLFFFEIVVDVFDILLNRKLFGQFLSLNRDEIKVNNRVINSDRVQLCNCVTKCNI